MTESPRIRSGHNEVSAGVRACNGICRIARHVGERTMSQGQTDRRSRYSRSSKLTILPSSDSRALVYHRDRQVLSTPQHDSVARVN